MLNTEKIPTRTEKDERILFHAHHINRIEPHRVKRVKLTLLALLCHYLATAKGDRVAIGHAKPDVMFDVNLVLHLLNQLD